ncbi:MOSC domain-containing protein [Novosphingobium mathurense]|uniref:MOSC domain-containing protein n=1 Tax=Novosphingobium mathurense TaxID=428990 RepID=A0A1U6H2H8_9SPHN|nr:MOSC domain-containing protein [Novosphingobium mathurense]SLJ89947.1 MOSC domain-containing protein [Novosphingobium mathurense]
MEELPSVAVTAAAGVQGDFRGVVRQGPDGRKRQPRRQVSLIELESWHAALHDLHISEDALLPWHARRANLCVSGLRLPREAGAVIVIGPNCRIEITMECDPCSRMDEIKPGLMAALAPDWRGGVLGRVLDDGEIAVGNEVRIEQ